MARKRYSKEEIKKVLMFKKEYGTKCASEIFGIKTDTITNWERKVRDGKLIIEGFTKCSEEKLKISDKYRQLKDDFNKIKKDQQKLLKENDFLKEAKDYFYSTPSEVNKNERIKFIMKKTNNGKDMKNINFYCRVLNVSRQAVYKHIKSKNKIWKYDYVVNLIEAILNDDDYNDMYGRKRMSVALKEKYPDKIIPSEQIIYRIIKKRNLKNEKKCLRGITVVDKDQIKSEDLIKRDFYVDKPYTKLITDITEIKCRNKKIYVSAIFDCFNLKVLSLKVYDNMQKEIVVDTLNEAYNIYPQIRGAILHSDRGSQYTSKEYRYKIKLYGIKQSMNSDKGRCHDNARCEAMWAIMKRELFYGRYDTKNMDDIIIKKLIYNYYLDYWNNRRICSAIGNVSPIKKEKMYYESIRKVA